MPTPSGAADINGLLNSRGVVIRAVAFGTVIEHIENAAASGSANKAAKEQNRTCQSEFGQE